MSSWPAFDSISIKQKFRNLSLETLYKSLTIFSPLIFVFYILILYNQPFNQFEHKLPSSSDVTNSPTNISHIMFVLVGSTRTWKFRRPYIESWWKENLTRGNIWLDFAPPQEFLPWPSTSPCFRINEDMTKLKVYPKLVSPNDVRIYHSILETFRLGDNKDVRWYVMGDDDTVIFVDNLVEVLGKYDHTKYNYIGMNSESIKSNFDFSFEMGFGGGGYALSYSLVEALATRIEECIEKYPYFRVSDILSASCSADLGVDLTVEKGFHQIDLRGDISGLLSSHPRSPLLSLHHFDAVNPIFPSKDRSESVNHLMEAANVDQSRLLQQTICYHRQTNWSFSISWGYSAHIYESLFPRSFLRKPLETFRPWKNFRPPLYMFNTRLTSYGDPCEAPHQFFLESVRSGGGEEVITSYIRSSSRNLPACSANGNHSADHISRIQVFSPAKIRKEVERIECCDVEYVSGKDSANVKLRACTKGEIVA